MSELQTCDLLLSLKRPLELGVITVIPNLQVGKLRPRGVKQLARSSQILCFPIPKATTWFLSLKELPSKKWHPFSRKGFGITVRDWLFCPVASYGKEGKEKGKLWVTRCFQDWLHNPQGPVQSENKIIRAKCLAQCLARYETPDEH